MDVPQTVKQVKADNPGHGRSVLCW